MGILSLFRRRTPEPAIDDTPPAMVHYLHFPDKEIAEEAGTLLRDRNFNVDLKVDDDDDTLARPCDTRAGGLARQDDVAAGLLRRHRQPFRWRLRRLGDRALQARVLDEERRHTSTLDQRLHVRVRGPGAVEPFGCVEDLRQQRRRHRPCSGTRPADPTPSARQYRSLTGRAAVRTRSPRRAGRSSHGASVMALIVWTATLRSWHIASRA